MSWARFDDQMPDNPKILAAGPLCQLVHANAILWCARNLTDGHVPYARAGTLVDLSGVFVTPMNPCGLPLRRVAADAQVAPPAMQDLIDHLVATGLWEVTDTGYVVHDYLGYNPSKAEVLASREKGRGRAAKSRGNRRAQRTSDESNASGSGERSGEPTPHVPPNERRDEQRMCAPGSPDPVSPLLGGDPQGFETFFGEAESTRVAASDVDDVRGCGCDACAGLDVPADLDALKRRSWCDYPHLRGNVYAAVASAVWVHALRGAPPANVAALDCVPSRRIALAGLVTHLRAYLADPSVDHPSLGRFMQVFGDYGTAPETRRNRKQPKGMAAIGDFLAEARAEEAAAEAERLAAAGGGS